MSFLESIVTGPKKLSVKLQKTAIQVSGSFWFAPLMMVFVAIFFGLLLSPFSSTDLSILNLLKINDVTASQGMSNLVASSTISVISIAFSMTLVALVMASSQFGPRIIRSFMESKKTQFTLGLFTSTFVYSVIVYTKLNTQNKQLFEQAHSTEAYLGYPVAVVFISAILCVVTLIFFIHHVASSIQADNVVETIAKSLMADMKALQQHHDSSQAKNNMAYKLGSNEAKPTLSEYSEKYQIRASLPGYVQAIEYGALVQLAKKSKGFIELNSRAGKYLINGASIATLYTNDPDINLDAYTQSRFLEIGDKRTPLQDPEYAISQLVEIALRALSPSMDDPHTAKNCIDKIACALGTFTVSNLPSNLMLDTDDKARLVTCDESFAEIFANAFTQIRQSAVQRPAVVCHLLDTFHALIEASDNPEHLIAPIKTQAMALKKLFSHQSQLHCELDLTAINQRLRKLGISDID